MKRTKQQAEPTRVPLKQVFVAYGDAFTVFLPEVWRDVAFDAAATGSVDGARGKKVRGVPTGVRSFSNGEHTRYVCHDPETYVVDVTDWTPENFRYHADVFRVLMLGEGRAQ
jgi:hypothetical protein